MSYVTITPKTLICRISSTGFTTKIKVYSIYVFYLKYKRGLKTLSPSCCSQTAPLQQQQLALIHWNHCMEQKLLTKWPKYLLKWKILHQLQRSSMVFTIRIGIGYIRWYFLKTKNEIRRICEIKSSLIFKYHRTVYAYDRTAWLRI